MRDGFRVFDTHAHIGTAHHSGRTCSAEELLAAMDGAGVDRSLAIPFPVVEDQRAAHDEIGRAVRDYPDRFTGTACLHPFMPRAEFHDELRRCVEVHGFRALKLQPQYHGLNPLSPRHEFFFEAACEFDLAVVCHTGTGAPFALPSLYIMPARKFPELKLIIGHAGGPVYVGEAIVAATVCPNVWIELSSLMPHHVLEVVRHVPASRLMIGSDLPESLDAEIGKIAGLGIPRAERAQILWDAPALLFGV